MIGHVVLDSSALLAVLNQEQGAERVLADSERCVISSVNLAEVQTKLVNIGWDQALAWRHIGSIPCASVPFDDHQAQLAGSLVGVTRPFGLSLGDRACLALAIERKASVYTTDRVWTKLDLGIRIEAIR